MVTPAQPLRYGLIQSLELTRIRDGCGVSVQA